ncbi:MAG: methyltransferase domain-containing protein [Candidatus Aenigmatarchaeota archaeon]
MLSEAIYNDWMEKTQLRKLEQILSKVRPEGRILDVGAGPGFLERLAEAVATDVDLKNLRKVAGSKVLCSGDALPFADKSFDWVFCIDTLHKLKSADEVKRVGKRAVVSMFCNERNVMDKVAELRKIGKGEIFIVKAEKEWDAVLVLVP